MSENGTAGLSQTEKALSAAADKVATARQDVTKLNQNLSGQIQGMGMKWGGQGATAFHNLHSAWQDKANKIVTALDQFQQSLLDTEKDNTSTDLSQADASTRLLDRLN